MKIGFRLFQKTNTKENFLPSLLNLNFVLVNLNNDAQQMFQPPGLRGKEPRVPSLGNSPPYVYLVRRTLHCTCDKISQAVSSNVCILEQKAKA